MKWTKRKGRTGEPSHPFLVEEKFTFERMVSAAVLKHDIQLSLVINLDHSSLSYIYQGKNTFSCKGTKNLSIKGVDDKSQITETFVFALLISNLQGEN